MSFSSLKSQNAFLSFWNCYGSHSCLNGCLPALLSYMPYWFSATWIPHMGPTCQRHDSILKRIIFYKPRLKTIFTWKL
jgi:hypothetical protein